MSKALFYLFLLALPLPVLAQNINYNFRSEKDADREHYEEAKLGDGSKKTDNFTFTLDVENLSTEELKDIRVLVYVVAAANDFKTKTPLQVVKVIEKKQLLAPAQTKTVLDIGKAEFVTTYTRNGNTLWRSGMMYEGYGVEVYAGEKLVYEDRAGGGDAKRAIEDFKEKGDKKKK